MIVLPLNEEARSGRSLPWVTLALVAACLFVFLQNRAADLEVEERTDLAVEEVWVYFEAHPYVKVDPEVAAILGEEDVQATASLFLQQLRSSSSPGIPDFVRRHDQLEFDSLVDRVYDATESHSFSRLGFFPETLRSPDVSLFSYVLVHEDWPHLASNLLIVLLAGLFLEAVWGRVLFSVFLGTGAVAAAAGYALLDPGAAEALGGASGVGAALAGAFLVRFFTTRIRFQYFLIPPFGGKFTARGWITLPLYGGVYLLADYVLTQGAPGIEPVSTEFATWAHVGGAAWGAFFALVMKLGRIEERFIDPKMEQKAVSRSNPLLERALEAREAGRVEEAVELLAGEVVRNPGNHDANLAYWDAANAVGRASQAADAIVRVLHDEVAAGQKELAVQHWRELTQRAPDCRVEAVIEAKVAAFLIDAGEHDLATFSVRRILEGRCGPVSARTVHKLARMAQDLDTGIALRAARKALAAKDLEPKEREEVEQLARQLEGVSEREANEASQRREEDTKGQSNPLFDSGYDFHEPDDPNVRELEAEEGEEEEPPALEEAGGPDEDGDTLNAEPFELDDLSAPPGIASYDLEGDDDDTLGSLDADDLSVPTPPEPVATLPPAEPSTSASLSGQASRRAPDDDAIPLADDSIRIPRHASMDDTGAPDFGTTIDMSTLGAETIPGYADEGVLIEPLPPPPPSAPSPPPEPEEPGVELPELSAPPARRRLKKMEAIPLALGDEAITLDVGERGKAQLGVERIDAVSVAGVRGLRAKPVIVIDLVTNWLEASSEPLKIVRLRSDRFDPRQLVPEEESGFRALKIWIARLLEHTQALALPDAASAVGAPFQMFDGLAEYEHEILRVEPSE